MAKLREDIVKLALKMVADIGQPGTRVVVPLGMEYDFARVIQDDHADLARLRAENERLHLAGLNATERVQQLEAYSTKLRASRDQWQAEAEKWRGAAAVLCGAHIGVPQEACPVCERDQWQARAEKAEARVWLVESALKAAVAILDGEHGDWREFFYADACVIDAPFKEQP